MNNFYLLGKEVLCRLAFLAIFLTLAGALHAQCGDTEDPSIDELGPGPDCHEVVRLNSYADYTYVGRDLDSTRSYEYDCASSFTWRTPEFNDNVGVDSIAICFRAAVSGSNTPLQLPATITFGPNTTPVPASPFDLGPVKFYSGIDYSNPNDCFGETKVTYKIYDACGNVDSCYFLVKVYDNEIPMAVCNDINVKLTGSSYELTQADIDSITFGSKDNCGIERVIVTPTTFTNLGPHTVNVKIIDYCGGVDECNAEVYVCVPPVITCPPNDYDLPPGCNPIVPDPATIFNIAGEPNPNPGIPTVLNGCPPMVLTSNDVISDVGCTRTVTRTYTITDDCDQVDQCVQTFTFTFDTIPPTFNEVLPADVTVECDAIPDAAILTASDNCPIMGTVSPFIRITEIHYDNVGTDADEFIEVSGTAGFDLSNCEIALYNGSNSMVYDIMTLSGTIDDEGAGFGAIDFVYPVNGIQNGAPDGMALVCDGVVVEFLSYEGTITAVGGPADGMTSTDIGVSESSGTPIGESLQLIGNGCDNSTLSWVGPSPDSRGSLNTGLTFSGCPTQGLIVTFTETETPAGTCPQERTITRTWTVTDDCGNTASHTQTIVVEDTTPPVFVCPPMDTLVDCDAVPGIPVVTAIDACEPPGTLVWVNEFHYDNFGGDVGEFIEVAGVAGTDLTGYILALYNGTNSVRDVYNSINLSGVLPNESGCGYGALAFDAPGLMNGSPDGFALVDPSGTVLEFLSYEGTFTAVGGPAVGMTSVDVGVSEPGQIGESLQRVGTGGMPSAFSWTGPVAESPGSLNAGQEVQGPIVATFLGEVRTDGDCLYRYILTRTWEAVDACGNSDQHVQVITVQDTVPPLIVGVPADTLVDCDAVPAPAMPTATDNCDMNVVPVFNEVRTDGDCPFRYTLTRTWTATDVCGNTSMEVQVVTVQDTVAPVLIGVPADTLVDCDAIPAPPVVTATDNCDPNVVPVFTEVRTDGDCPFRYTLTRTWTATDVCGNTSQDSQIVTVQDTVAPVLIGVPADTLVDCDAVPAPAMVTATDNCDPNVVPVFVEVRTDGDCPFNYILTRTWTATDVCGNATSDVQVVTVQDTTAPVIAGIPPDVTVDCDAVPAPVVPTVTDNCSSSITETFTEVRVDGNCPFNYTLTRTWTATDECDNMSEETRVVTVQDVTDPMAVCRDITVQLDANGEATITAQMLNGGSTDNCSAPQDLTFSASKTSFDCSDLNQNGTPGCATPVTVVLTVTDECGNSSTCNAIVTVEDNIAPTFMNCPKDITITLDPGACEYIYNFAIFAMDNCDTDVTVTQTDGPVSGTALEKETTTLFRFEAEDNCGNISVCTYDVIIEEFPNPRTSLACNSGIQVSLDDNCEAIVGADDILEGTGYGCYDDYIVELFYDAAKTQPVPTSPMLTRTEIGLTIYTLVTDPDTGNKCWGDLTVEDKVVPDLDCPEPIIVDCSDDISPEVLGFPVASTVTVTPNGPNSYILDGFDPCSPATLVYVDDVVTDQCAAINSVITRTWTVTDGTGNTSSCVQTISTRRVGITSVTLPPNYDGINNPALDCSDRCEPLANRPSCGNTVLGWNVLPDGHPYAGHPSPYDDLYPCNGQIRCFGTGVPSGGCSNIQFTFEDTRINICTSGPSEGCYKILRKWTILDWCTGEIRRENQLIKVEDNEAPQIADVADLTISVDVWGCEADWLATEPWLMDNCSSEPLSYTVASTGGTVQALPDGRYRILDLTPGVYNITYVASDCCGNAGDSTIQLTVVDDVAPVAVCDGHTVVSISRTTNIADENLGLTKIFATTFDDGSYDNCSNEVWFKAIRMDEYDSNGNGKFPELVRDGDWSSIDCDAANGDDDLRTRPSFYQGPQSYFDDYVKLCCEDIADGPIMVVFRVYDVDPEPYTFGKVFPQLVPAGENPDDYNGVLPEAQDVGGALYGRYDDCMIEVTVQDKLPPYVVAPPNITVTCDYWFPFDADNPADYTDELDAIFGKVVEGSADPLDRDSIVIKDRVCPAHPRFAEFAPANPVDDQCYDDKYDIFWGYDGYVLDNCSVDLEQTIIPDLHCGRGNILRRWRAGDDAGNWSNIATQVITIIDCKEFYVPGVCWRFTQKDIGECDRQLDGSYKIKLIEWPCDVEVNRCQTAGLDALLPENLPVPFDQDRRPRYDDDNCNLLGATYEDRTFTFVDNACVKIFRDWTVIDWCLYEDGVTPFEWHWTQVIKLLNTEGPVFDDCEDREFCGFGDPAFPNNNQCVGEVVLEPGITDDCSELATIRTDYKIDAFNDGTYDILGYSDNHPVNPFGVGVSAAVYPATMPNANGKYPVGEHRILWTAEDGCGNITTCEYLFTVQDCKAPTPYCRNGVSTIPMSQQAGGYVDIWASDYNIGSYDNCTAQDDLIYSFSDDPTDQSRRFTCADAPGLYNLTVYVWDLGLDGLPRNFATCGVTIQLEDCSNQTTYHVAGTIEDEVGRQASDVRVMISGDDTDEMMTDDSGIYDFLLVEQRNYVVTPENDLDHRNGVSTFDLVLISKHITGQQALNSPYKMIAADVNKTGSITTFDIIEMRKLILYINTEFPDNTSWRFIDEGFQFVDPSNPFASTFPESYNINGLDQDMDINFVAIKIGDVNESARANNLVAPGQTRSAGELNFEVKDQLLNKGEEYTVDFTAADFADILGYQFTLNYSDAVEVTEVKGGVLAGLAEGNFGKLSSAITTSWNAAKAANLSADDVVFSITLTANTNAKLSDVLSISSEYTSAEAYNAAGFLNVALNFTQEAGAKFALYQNQPNPFADATVIGFNLPQAGTATLSIYDVAGKVLKVVEGDYSKGYNEVTVNRSELGEAGLLYYTLKTENRTATKKMIIVE